MLNKPATNSRTWLLTLLLVQLVVFCVFANTFGHNWTYDDFPVIVDNPDVRSVASFLADSYPGRPLREITYLVDYSLFGYNPAGWHIQQLFWHGMAGFLLALLMARAGLGWAAGGCAGLLFVVHPVTVEVVANISHRKDSLALVFSLLALLAYHQALQASSRRIIWLLLSGLSVCLAYLGKQTAVGMPFVLLAYEWTFVERPRWLLLRWWKYWLGLCGAALLTGLAWLTVTGKWAAYLASAQGILQTRANYFDAVNLSVYSSTLLKSWAFSAGKLVWPVDLAAEYNFPVPGSWSDPWALAGLLLVAAFIGLLIWSGKRRLPVFPWLVLAVIFYLPVMNLWPLAYLAADRYLYGPLAGLAMVTGWLLVRCVRRGDMALTLTVLLMLPLSYLTWQQNSTWSNPESLWNHAYRVNPESSLVLNNLGNVSLLKGDMEEAVNFYQKALSANPDNPTSWYNLGMIAERQGKMRQAVTYYQKFINLNLPLWQRETTALQQRLLSNYGIRLQQEKIDP